MVAIFAENILVHFFLSKLTYFDSNDWFVYGMFYVRRQAATWAEDDCLCIRPFSEIVINILKFLSRKKVLELSSAR